MTNVRFWLKTALGIGAIALGTASVHAQTAERLEHSGNVYHRAVCSRAVAPGQARCHAHVVTDAAGTERNGKVTANVTPSGYAPADLRSAYNVVGATGTGIIAIVDAYGYSNAESDLGVYRAQYGLGACTTANGCFIKINQNGGTSYPANNIGWAQEQALDLDMASAMCPTCKIMLVQASSASLGNLAAAVNMAASRGAIVISNSYGAGETGTATYASAYNKPGIAITASTGDSGYGVQFPASDTGVIAVGGTHLVRVSGGGWAESAWSGGGSGCSTLYAKPAWQHDALCAFRMEADLAAVADPATGVAVYGPNSQGRSSWLVFGGTSVSAPLVGGIYAAYNIRPTNAASNIWAMGYAKTSPLHDVTSGTNGTCGGTYLCTAGAGYDGPTGWGTPNGVGGL